MVAQITPEVATTVDLLAVGLPAHIGQASHIASMVAAATDRLAAARTGSVEVEVDLIVPRFALGLSTLEWQLVGLREELVVSVPKLARVMAQSMATRLVLAMAALVLMMVVIIMAVLDSAIVASAIWSNHSIITTTSGSHLANSRAEPWPSPRFAFGLR